MAGKLREDSAASAWVEKVIDNCTMSYRSRKDRYFSSVKIMEMIVKEVDGRWCQVPYNEEVNFTIIAVMKDYEITDYFITKDCGTPASDKLVEMVFVNTLANSMPRQTMHTVNEESLVTLELSTINTKIVHCKLNVKSGTRV